jgi:hypothetical protein
MKYLYSWAYVLATGLALAGLAVVLFVGHVIRPGPLWQIPWVMALVPGLAMAVGFPFWLARMLRSVAREQRVRVAAISPLTAAQARDAWITLSGPATPGPDGSSTFVDSQILRVTLGPPATAAELTALGHAHPTIIECFRRHRFVSWSIDPAGLAATMNVGPDDAEAKQIAASANAVSFRLDLSLAAPWPNLPTVMILGVGPSSRLWGSSIAADKQTGVTGVYSRPRETSTRPPRLLDGWTHPEFPSLWHELLAIHATQLSDLQQITSIVGKKRG